MVRMPRKHRNLNRYVLDGNLIFRFGQNSPASLQVWCSIFGRQQVSKTIGGSCCVVLLLLQLMDMYTTKNHTGCLKRGYWVNAYIAMTCPPYSIGQTCILFYPLLYLQKLPSKLLKFFHFHFQLYIFLSSFFYFFLK